MTNPHQRMVRSETIMETKMQTRLSRLRLALPMMAALASTGSLPALAADPSAAGLWQKIEDGKPVIYVLVADSGGTFEGIIAKTFPDPENSADVCSQCSDDRKNAPVLGISFIRNMRRDGLKYEDGNVLDPRDGKIYSAKMSLSPDGKLLTMRGYFGISLLGRDGFVPVTGNRVGFGRSAIIARYLPTQTATMKPAANAKTAPSAH